MSKFKEKYQTLSNAALIDILDNSAGYEEEAVVAAKEEFEKRGLNNEQLNAARNESIKKVQEKNQFKKAIKESEKVVSSKLNEFIATLNPLQSSISKEEKQIRSIVWFFIFISIYNVIQEWDFFLFYLEEGVSNISLEIILFYFSFFLLPTGTLFLILRKKIGWILICFELTMNLVNSLIQFMHFLTSPKTQSLLDDFLPEVNYSNLVLGIIIHIILLWIIIGKNLTSSFRIKKIEFFATTFLAMIWPIYLVFFHYNIF